MTAQLLDDLLNYIWKLQFSLMKKRVAKLAKKYFSIWYTVRQKQFWKSRNLVLKKQQQNERDAFTNKA